MIEKYTLDMLTKDSVSVKKQSFIEFMGQPYPTGEVWRRAYVNSEQGRQQVAAELPQTEANAIMTMWGDFPTVIEEVTE